MLPLGNLYGFTRQWFQVSVVNGRLRDASYGPDPLCDIDRDD